MRYYSTWQEEESYREGRRDAEYGRKDYSRNEHFGNDSDRAYYEGLREAEREEERRREIYEQERQEEERQYQRQQEYYQQIRDLEEQEYYNSLQEAEEYYKQQEEYYAQLEKDYNEQKTDLPF